MQVFGSEGMTMKSMSARTICMRRISALVLRIQPFGSTERYMQRI